MLEKKQGFDPAGSWALLAFSPVLSRTTRQHLVNRQGTECSGNPPFHFWIFYFCAFHAILQNVGFHGCDF